MNWRSIFSTGFAFLCLTFFAAAIAVPFAEIRNASGLVRIDMGIWTLCTEVVKMEEVNCKAAETALFASCDERRVFFLAARGFQCAAAIVTLALCVICCVRFCVRSMRAKGAVAHGIVAGFFFLVMVLSGAGWGAALTLYNGSFCSGTRILDLDNARIGPNAPLMITGWVLSIVGFVLELLLKDDHVVIIDDSPPKKNGRRRGGSSATRNSRRRPQQQYAASGLQPANRSMYIE